MRRHKSWSRLGENELDNESDLIRIKADWQPGNHLLTAGFEREEYSAAFGGTFRIFSLRLHQEIKIGQTALDLFLDIESLGNLINSDWGRADSYTAPSNVAPSIVDIDAGTNQYILTPNAGYQGTVDTTMAQPAITRIASACPLQFDVRWRF